MPGYGEIAPYGSLDYKQDLDQTFLTANKINAYTGVCLGYALTADQGQGYAFLMNRSVPEAWIWPDPMSDPMNILDSKNQKRYLVLDEITGRWHEIGTRNGPKNSGMVAAYQDKMSDRYAGTEIPCGLKLREHIGRAEHEWVEHIETHAYMRPQAEENQGKAGYTADGYRMAQEIEIRGYKHGEIAESARTKDVPLEGDFVFDRRLKDHRVQIGFFTSASEFRLAGLDQYYLLADESATTKAMSEHNWQNEFASPWLWLSRGPNPTVNRATGATLTGSYFSLVDGPDGKDSSAMMFAPTNGLTYGAKSITGDYSLVFSVNNLVLPCAVIGPVSVMELHGVKYLQLSYGGNTLSCPLAWNGTGWVALMLKREGNNLVFSENGAVKGTYLDKVGDISQSIAIMDTQDGELGYVWAFDTAISDKAFAYWYSDLTENHGDALLPVW